ncbi:DUF4349 domain-containing protein [Erythrobacter sp. SDW2]|uniref:DUF4349 domain-containing protein n=1 Tax=Erythrobacter sp. SDW2 TaxID=2907154 RepID=UPI001F2C1F76|nr:DUF4349 domain-containing protein [Erythrobacter sp. SDW2]UIP06405.1 DUF4349 domain-containing protein [Erythrobacter sp. SDW2]
MRRIASLAAAASLLALGACQEAQQDDAATADVAESAEAMTKSAGEADAAMEEAPGTRSAFPELAEIPVTLPQLAYVYDYRWRMPAAEIGALQRRHASLCEQQGAAICQILGMSKSGEEESEVTGVLEMAVASKQARAFGALLEDEAEDAGAEQVSAEIASEELSKNIVDTEARLAARTDLRDRLLQVLRTHKGTVEELVEAERSVAQVNEEIDQARSWLKEMQGRVAYSKVTVNYETGTPVTSDFLAPVTGALGSLGTIFGYMLAILIIVGAVALPIGGMVWASRALGRRMAPPAASEA